MKSFADNYKMLNSAQRLAVDTIDGPVMVVAGPGTGKTQLLSMRVANILRIADVDPGNILCLTFTESGASAMRQRLIDMVGVAGHKVLVHTFHSFGAEIINHNPEFFYKGANFRPADELSSFEIIEPILAKLAHSNPLASTMNGQFTALGDIKKAITDLKKAGLTPDELNKIVADNNTFISQAQPILSQAFDIARLSKKDLPAIQNALDQLQKLKSPPSTLTKSLGQICCNALEEALNSASESNSTTPITAWRNTWLERDHRKKYILKDQKNAVRLSALAKVYQDYLVSMQEKELFDFDDMILKTVHAVENFADLRYNLQEKFLYIMVDEFQDTNGAQLRLLKGLLDSESSNGKPNIMVVGDDDQAIYAFQGAELSNIIQFRDLYKDTAVITLIDNYRSTQNVLKAARSVITQGQYRLENTMKNINKELTAHQTNTLTSNEAHQFETPDEQYFWIANKIKNLQAAGTKGSDIAILARNHKQLLQILPYLKNNDIKVNYERSSNILEAEHIKALITLARTVVAISDQNYELAESLLPNLFSYDFWGLTPIEVWKVSLEAHKERKLWLELMLEKNGRLHDIAEFLIVCGGITQHIPLEQALDILIGSQEKQAPNDDVAEEEPFTESSTEDFDSPFRAYYFNAQRLDKNPAEYLDLLSNLSTLRQKLRNYKPDQALNLADFVDFVDLHQKTKTQIVDISDHREKDDAINLMTAHKAKGLEFDSVFVLSCQEKIWGNSARKRSSSLKFPNNLPISVDSQTDDDHLRLFFVAMTRAKNNLYLTYFKTDENHKASLPAAFLNEAVCPITTHNTKLSASQQAVSLELTWQTKQLNLTESDKKVLLAPRLEKYQLNATHLNNFLDVSNGGPQAFLLQNLLRFPQSMHRSAIFGTVIHSVLQKAHVQLTASGERIPTEDILQDFEIKLQNSRLHEIDYNFLLDKGSEVLANYINIRYDSFNPNQKSEYSLRGVQVDKALLTGNLDLLDIDKAAKTIIVTDYKTGKAPSSWQGSTDFEKIKLHKYRQQLMMYKLLIENSRDFMGYKVHTAILEFVEPATDNSIKLLEMTFDSTELERFKKLVQVVWQKIITLDLPDVSKYSPDYSGMIVFEEDLLQN